MKKLLFSFPLIFFCFHVQGMEEFNNWLAKKAEEARTDWIAKKIEACKKGENQECFFIAQYISAIYPMLCKNQGRGLACRKLSCSSFSSTHTDSQEEACKLLATALTDEKFIAGYLATKGIT